ncbi:MAG: glycosyltransferase family 4 protein, partial [Bacteroidota bacterium]
SLIHAHDAHAHSLALLAEAVNGRAIPLVVSRRVDFPIRKSRLSRNKYHHPRVHKIICVSKAIERITAAGLDNPGVLTTVHSGIDPERFPQGPVSGKLRQEFGIPSTTPLVGNVAALAPHKDYFTFLDTVRFLQQEGLDARYLIIGDGPQKEEIQRYARDHGLTDVVLFTGFRSDIPEVLPELDLFLITSETEGLGTSILDAFACRVPVVATRAGGIPELVEHESTGLLAPVKAPTELGAAVLRMLGDAALRERVVATASEKLQGFTKDAMAAKTLAVYQEVVRKLS